MITRTNAAKLNSLDGTAAQHEIHLPHRAQGKSLQAAIDQLHSVLAAAPALPNLFPQPPDVLRQCAQLLAEEHYPAVELLARPLDDALSALRHVVGMPERRAILWGVGTMTCGDAARKAAELKPDFLVSPAFSRPVLKVAVEAGIPYIPAVLTFQDVQTVLEAFAEFGLTVRLLKLCPVFNITADYVKALSGCYPGISFCPTGEITLENFLYWKRTAGIIAPMGAELVPSEMLDRRDYAAIRKRLRLLRELAATVTPTAMPIGSSHMVDHRSTAPTSK